MKNKPILLSSNSLPENFKLDANLGSSCEVLCSRESLESFSKGKLKISVKQHSGSKELSNVFLSFGCVSGQVSISLSDNYQRVVLGAGVKGRYMLRLNKKSSVCVGDKTTSNGVSVYCSNSEFVCGYDCMFSSDVLVQTSDQHGIVDIEKKRIVNDRYMSTIIGDHVWLGRRSVLTSNLKVGDGSVIGTGAIVTKSLAAKVVAVGVPAAVVKENFTWSRDPESLDEFSAELCEF